jgi:hypothetical protein
LPLTHMPAESAASWEGMELGSILYPVLVGC